MTNTIKLSLGLGLLLLLGVGGFALRQHIRTDAIRDLQTHSADSTAKIERDSIAKASTVAQEAAKQADAAKTAALQQVAHSEALRRIADSVAKTSSAERDSARRLLADSIASVEQYRAEVTRLVEAGVRDSAASRRSLDGYEASTRKLLATITADSVALFASQQHARSLEALQASLTAEVKLLRAAKPSKFGAVVEKVLWTAAGGGVGYLVGKASK